MKISHIIADGYSVRIFIDDVVRAYLGQPLSELIQYERFYDENPFTEHHPIKKYWAAYWAEKRTPLFMAIIKRNIEMFQLLIDFNSDLDDLDIN